MKGVTVCDWCDKKDPSPRMKHSLITEGGESGFKYFDFCSDRCLWEHVMRETNSTGQFGAVR